MTERKHTHPSQTFTEAGDGVKEIARSKTQITSNFINIS